MKLYARAREQRQPRHFDTECRQGLPRVTTLCAFGHLVDFSQARQGVLPELRRVAFEGASEQPFPATPYRVA